LPTSYYESPAEILQFVLLAAFYYALTHFEMHLEKNASKLTKPQ